jgi:UPF0716 protein FxsA
MASSLPFFFLLWPVAEIAAVVIVAGWIGWPAAIGAIILSSMVGMALLRRQGLGLARRAQADLQSGLMPAESLFDAACLAVAGLLLALPGFVTDLLALLLLIGPIRGLIGRWLQRRFAMASGTPSGTSPGGAPVIDGDWVVVDEKKDPEDHTSLPGR